MYDVWIVKILKKQDKITQQNRSQKIQKKVRFTNHFLLNFHEHFIGKHCEKVNAQKFGYIHAEKHIQTCKYIEILEVHFKCIKSGPGKMHISLLTFVPFSKLD